MENVNIWDKVFYTKLSEYRMADWTFQVECRIHEVVIKGEYNYEDEPTKYLFIHENANLNATAEELAATEEEAREYAKNKIAGIAVLFKPEEVKEVEEDK